MKALLMAALFALPSLAIGQESAAKALKEDSISRLSNGYENLKAIKRDTVRFLNEVVVHAYSADRPLMNVPAAIGIVNSVSLERFNNTSILSAVNMIPGVRMEERSPGSYRFAVRGSSLRSPFGVRNVKMYWNGLPLTDGGGNTYLNLVDFNAIGKAEIIKGPGASLYGAGTGGVVLLTSPAGADHLQVSTVGGSYGLARIQVNGQTHAGTTILGVNAAHQQADGYRQQTRMRRDAFNMDASFRLKPSDALKATLFYTDLYYQTPGGLTKAQYDADPRQARPSGATPGAVEQQAAVYNKTFYTGVLYDHQWSNQWSTRIGTYGSITDFTNPTLRNYEIRKEYNWGARTETHYQFQKTSVGGKITVGGEYQHFYSPLTDYDNNSGTAGNLQTDDRLTADLLLLFAQAEIELPADFFLTLGGSENFMQNKFNRVSDSPPVFQQRTFDPVFSPRAALLKKLTGRLSLYGSISNGFSPPSLAEVRPSTGTYNNTLNPERGTSYELGFRGALGNALSFDMAVYDFELSQTIVVQQQVNGADYFVNAGNTTQKGLEAMVSWTPVIAEGKDFFKVWGSLTVNHFRFDQYVQNGLDYSGNQLTGVARTMFASGMDFKLANRLYTNVTLNYVDRIPLNDANSAYSSSYFLAGMRLGYQWHTSMPWELFAGVDNAGNQRYSLGNDLNAVGGRYYNAAAGRNFYVGAKLMLKEKK